MDDKLKAKLEALKLRKQLQEAKERERKYKKSFHDEVRRGDLA